MEKIMFAQKAFIINDGKLLLIRKSENAPIEPNKWEVPGGRINFGESIEDHIKREVKEEVGIDIEVGEPFDIWTFFIDSSQNADKTQVVVVARFCKPKSLNINFLGHDETDYISEYYWLPVQEVLKYDLISNMIPTIKKCIDLCRGNQ
jgi:8-oxo-dGTP pyrophosphatase MutT (NUDIX family)